MYQDGNRVMAWVTAISDVTKHPDADSLDICTVGGWQCITKLGEFKQGDLAVYCSIDSWIPEPLAPFLTKGNKAKEYQNIVGNRLRTVKLRKQVSQGLLLPMSVLSQVCQGNVFQYQDGDDVTELLGIVKYDPPVPACLSGEVEGMFPSFISKTDQERVQNIIKRPRRLVGTWEVTLKLDGSSMTMFVNEEQAGVCSRNLHLKDNEQNDGNTLVQLARSVDYTKMLPEVSNRVGFDFALQGEIMGPGIQNNREKFDNARFFVFDVYNISESRYLTREERTRVLDVINEYTALIEHVPVIHSAFEITEDFATMENFLTMSDRPSINHKYAEGIVFKNINNGDDSFKVISNLFLLKED